MSRAVATITTGASRRRIRCVARSMRQTSRIVAAARTASVSNSRSGRSRFSINAGSALTIMNALGGRPASHDMYAAGVG